MGKNTISRLLLASYSFSLHFISFGILFIIGSNASSFAHLFTLLYACILKSDT